MSISIEAARVADAEQIIKLQYLCYQREASLYDDYTIEPLTQSVWSLLTEYDTNHILVARLGEEVVGSVRGYEYDRTCYIGRLMVHPRMERQGLGRRLVLAIEAEFPSSDRYELFTGYRSEGNIRLYRSLGYEVFREKQVSDTFAFVYLQKHR